MGQGDGVDAVRDVVQHPSCGRLIDALPLQGDHREDDLEVVLHPVLHLGQEFLPLLRLHGCRSDGLASLPAAWKRRMTVPSVAAAVMKFRVSALKSRGVELSTSSTPQAAPSTRIGTFARDTIPCSFSTGAVVNSVVSPVSVMTTGSPVW
jgi:hypothetical protein